MTKHVLGYDQLPARLPFASTLAAALVLDRLDAHPVIWGAVGTIFAIAWIGTIYRFATEETAIAADLVEIQQKREDE